MRVVCFILVLFVSSLMSAQMSKEERTKEALEKAIEQEKKFAKEQKFYKYDNYDFKGSEVNEKSLDTVPILEPQDDFDMTHVYQ